MVDKVEDLKTYLAILDMGGVNAAAAELGIAKSAVSRRLSDLEKRLGVSLVDRGTRRFEPTAVGAEYARHARSILSSLEELDLSVAPGSGIGHSVTVRCSTVVAIHKIIPALGGDLVRYAGLRVKFVSENEAGQDGEDDIIVVDAAGAIGIASRPLFTTQLVACASPGYLSAQPPLERPQQLEAHGVIGIASAPAVWHLSSGDRRSSRTSIIVHDAGTAAAAAIAGLGLAQLPDFVVAGALAEGRLVRVLEGHEPAPTEFVANFSNTAAIEVRKFVDALASALT